MGLIHPEDRLITQLSIAAVRRMESGRVVRIADAIQVAAALQQPPASVFEQAFQVLQRREISLSTAFADLAWNDRALRDEMSKAGIDVRPAVWTLKVHFVGGEVRVWPILSTELDRFWMNLDHEERGEPRFFAFDSDEVTAAFNLCQMAYAHALFDAPGRSNDDKEDLPSLEILLAGEREWLRFGADFDEPDFDETDGDETDGDEPGAYQGRLNELLGDLESAPYSEPYVAFDDEDGERAVFRVSALTAVSVSQEVLWGRDDGLDDEVEPPPPPPPRSRRRRLKIVSPDAP